MENIKKLSQTEVIIRAAVSIMLCFLVAQVLDSLNIYIIYNGTQFDIVQKMVAGITVLFCGMDNVELSFKAGVKRLISTVLGALVAVFIVIIDNLISNNWIYILLVGAGIALTLVVCQVTKRDPINTKIAGLNFLCVLCVSSGSARIVYAGLRAAATIIGAAAVILVTWIICLIHKKDNRLDKARP